MRVCWEWKVPWRVKAVKMDVEGRRVEVEVECAERTGRPSFSIIRTVA